MDQDHLEIMMTEPRSITTKIESGKMICTMIMITRVDLGATMIIMGTEERVGVEEDEALTRPGDIKATVAEGITEEAEVQGDQVNLLV